MKHSQSTAFTLIELLVVISIIAILAGIALPVFGAVQVKGAQTKALSNAKQIGTALKLYSVDNNGVFPTYALTGGRPGTQQVTDSNTAFAQLIPDYIPSEDIFWLTKSKWCNVASPDNRMDQDSPDAPTLTLAAGENEWAYVLGLTDTSNPSFPIIANGFKDATAHTYSVNETEQGGVWRGKQAIVIRVDTSGATMKCTKSGGTDPIVKGPNGGQAEGDIFDTSNGANGWLGASNVTVNPKPPATSTP